MQNSPASQPSLEIAIVSGGRPDLLRRTLASFQELLFENFAIGRVSINIDPWFKEGRFVRECASIAGDFFPSAVILSPDSPSFGHAVKRLWQQSKCEFIFHLEDDWILEEPVLPDYVFPHFSPPVEQLRLYCKEMKGLRIEKNFVTSKKKYKIAGVQYWSRRIPNFGCGPGFWRGSFIREVAPIMRGDLDPEKQFRNGRNPALERHVRASRVRILMPRRKPTLVTDIGRLWREEIGISKEIIDGASVWNGN